MENAKSRYKKKVKTKLVVFYLHDADLYKYACSINFNRFVKTQLRKEMKNESKTSRKA